MFKRIRILAYDTRTKKATNFSVYNGSASPTEPKSTELDRVVRILSHEFEYRFHWLDAGDYSFQLRACFWQPDSIDWEVTFWTPESLADGEKCTDWSAPSKPLLPVPGDTGQGQVPGRQEPH
eukprot:TRINITY_DN2036_c0_g1_i5.p1 TRINITY_DN2036_c0_g1~~TRINITY_DN2036_c0_g1_i5.p1  ORF type:complete len:122 (+),score=4.22 TRINITY_DN2036_c0_g1_i5:381-746(+)